MGIWSGQPYVNNFTPLYGGNWIPIQKHVQVYPLGQFPCKVTSYQQYTMTTIWPDMRIYSLRAIPTRDENEND